MAMQDRAKANHDFGKDAKINHVLDKGSMVANPFFFVTPSVRSHVILAKIHVTTGRFRRYSRFAFRYYSLDVIPGHHGIPDFHTFIDSPSN